VSPSASWSHPSVFHCSECGHDEAYRSRPRGAFEKYFLPVLMLRPLRCERCYRRTYAWRWVPARLHAPVSARRSAAQGSGITSGVSVEQSRIA
jgi:hypothetical protein